MCMKLVSPSKNSKSQKICLIHLLIEIIFVVGELHFLTWNPSMGISRNIQIYSIY